MVYLVVIDFRLGPAWEMVMGARAVVDAVRVVDEGVAEGMALESPTPN